MQQWPASGNPISSSGLRQGLGGDEKSYGPFRQRISPHQGLESLAVIGLDEMSQLMHNHIILHPLGKTGQLVAYENGPGGAVAGPAPLLLAGEYTGCCSRSEIPRSTCG